MIRSLSTENFRVLREFAVTLEPLTVLVGPNGGGKTSVLRALAKLGRSPTFVAEDRWRLEGRSVAIRAIDDAGQRHEVAFERDGRIVENRVPIRIDTLAMSARSARGSLPYGPAPKLAEDGSNLTNAFLSLSRREQIEVSERFAELAGCFADVEAEPAAQGGAARLVFHDRWKPEVSFGLADVSDGSLVVLAILIAVHQHKPGYRQLAENARPDVLAIEDIEHGVHPYLVKELIDELRRLTTGAYGPPIQVLLTTHSPQVLNFVDPREVRFLSRRGPAGDIVAETAPFDHADWAKSFDANDRALGPMWMMGGLGGVPPS